NAPSLRWRCAVGAVSLLMVLQLGSTARADGTSVPAQTNVQRAPLPPPGTYRLIRIGPQALVKQDDRGNITTADELDDKPSRVGRGIAATIVVLTAGAVLMLHRIELNDDFGFQPVAR